MTSFNISMSEDNGTSTVYTSSELNDSFRDFEGEDASYDYASFPVQRYRSQLHNR
jgi:hypothetical protein